MKYSITTYGCQMNEADSELMAGLLRRAGWEQAESLGDADLIILNTCSVRRKPEQKVYSRLGELRRWKEADPGRVLAVTGCMAQRAGGEIVSRASHVDLVVGTRWFHEIAGLVARARSGERPVVVLDGNGDPSRARRALATPDTRAELRAFVPIIRGCSRFCSYCIVPYVRGPEISRSPDDIAEEVRDLVSRGAREVTLLGQNVLAYGKDRPEGASLPELLQRLDRIEELWRIRFTTCHPRDVTDELLDVMADLPSVCEHIHLPVQAGTDKLLGEMGRGYTTDRYRRIVAQLRARVPRVSITTDIMVGFPGETEEDFEQSLAFYREVRFDAAFTFAYSNRPGTPAAERRDQVPRRTRLARLARLIEMQKRISVERNQGRAGEETEVLVDGPAPRGEGLLAGRARSNKQVIFPGPAELIGCLVSVRLTEAHLWGLRGEWVSSAPRGKPA